MYWKINYRCTSFNRKADSVAVQGSFHPDLDPTSGGAERTAGAPSCWAVTGDGPRKRIAATHSVELKDTGQIIERKPPGKSSQRREAVDVEWMSSCFYSFRFVFFYLPLSLSLFLSVSKNPWSSIFLMLGGLERLASALLACLLAGWLACLLACSLADTLPETIMEVENQLLVEETLPFKGTSMIISGTVA